MALLTTGNDGMGGLNLLGGGDGGGMGGIGGGLLLGLLLGRGGLLGNNVADGVAANSVNTLESTMNTNAIMASLADIKASVPFNEAQVQLALSQVAAQLTAQATANNHALGSQIGAVNLSQVQGFAGVARDIAQVDTNIAATGTAVMMAVRDDGDKTRALITNNLIAELQADKVILANEVSELRNDSLRERDRHGVEITMTNNQNQNQLQFQEQRQTQNQIASILAGLSQSIHATNQAINIGSGGLIANPNNNNTNVRA